jgi:heat shock protein HtpX
MHFSAIVFLGALSALFGAVGSLFGLQAVAYALALSVVIAFWSFWSTPAKLIAIGAVEISDPKFPNLVSDLASRAGIPPPRVFEIADRQPNAFVLGGQILEWRHL